MLLDTSAWRPDPLFVLIQERGGVTDAEMRRAFNMGVGFAMVVPAGQSAPLIDALVAAGEDAFLLGQVTEGEGVSFSA